MCRTTQFVSTVICLCLAHGSVAAQKLYWTDRGTQKIQRINLYTSDPPEDVVTVGITNPMGLAVDSRSGMVYWTDAGASGGSDGAIFRAKPGCGATLELVNDLSDPRGLALDHMSGHMFWTDSNAIGKAALGGGAAENIVADLFPSPTGLALDSASDLCYFTSHLGVIRTVTLDGADLTTLLDLTIDSGPVAIALDISGGMIYWVEAFPFPKIGRANLDGSGLQFLPVPCGFDAGGIAVDPNEGKIYWTFGGDIHQANLDGSAYAPLNIPGLQEPFALAIDLENPGTTIYMDIRPGSCPNSVNTRSQGVLTVALAGSQEFDPAQVDLDTVRLHRSDGMGTDLEKTGVDDLRAVLADVTAPSCGGSCDCSAPRTPDGMHDLLLKFSIPDMVQAFELDTRSRKSVVMLRVSGNLLDGTTFEATDCITLAGKH